MKIRIRFDKTELGSNNYRRLASIQIEELDDGQFEVNTKKHDGTSNSQIMGGEAFKGKDAVGIISTVIAYMELS